MIVIFLLTIVGCSYTPNYEIEGNNIYATGDYKTALDYYYRAGIYDSDFAEECKKSIVKETVALTVNNKQQEKEGILYNIWELKEDPIISVSENLITVNVNIIYKSEKSIYEPNYLVTYSKTDDNWIHSVERVSYDGHIEDEFDINQIIRNLSYDNYYDLGIVNTYEVDLFNKIYAIEGKRIGGYAERTYRISISAKYDTVYDVWYYEKSNGNVVASKDISYSTLEFSSFSIDVPEYWTYEIEYEYSGEYGSVCTVNFSASDVFKLKVIDNYEFGFDDSHIAKLNDHCVESGFGMACPYDYETETNDLTNYVVEGEEHCMSIRRYNNLEDSVYYHIISSIK